MAYCSVGSRTVHYRTAGEGTVCVLLHGFPFSSESFWPQLEHPPRGCRLLLPDAPGFGRSSLAGDTTSMDDIAADVEAIIAAEHCPRAIIGGVSMGGYAAMAFARRRPDLTAGLVLLNTHARADDAAARTRREEMANDVARSGVGALVDDLLPRLFAPHAPRAVVHRLEKLMRTATPSAVAAALRGMASREDSRGLLARYSGPVIIVAGELDTIAPPARAHEMAELCGKAQCHVLPNVAHLAHLEEPESVAKLVSVFIDSVARGRQVDFAS